MPRDRRVGLERQPELAQADAPIACGKILRPCQWKESFSQRRSDFNPRQLRRRSPADHAPAAAEHRDGETVRRVAGQQRFLCSGAFPPQHLTLGEGEPRRREFLFGERRQCQIEVVAAEQQMLADGDAFEGQLFVLDAGANEAEVRRAAADVDDEDERLFGEALRQLPPVCRDPRVERGERLFEQRQPLEARRLRGFDRQLACFLVERRGHGQHDLLLLELRGIAARRVGVVPGVADVREQPRRRLDRRQPRLRLAAPRQQRRRPIDVWIREPGFRRRDLACGNQRAFVAGEHARDDVRRRVPRQCDRA